MLSFPLFSQVRFQTHLQTRGNIDKHEGPHVTYFAVIVSVQAYSS
jgi:hypothetical protein